MPGLDSDVAFQFPAAFPLLARVPKPQFDEALCPTNSWSRSVESGRRSGHPNWLELNGIQWPDGVEC